MEKNTKTVQLSHLMVMHAWFCAVSLLDSLHGLKYGIRHHFRCPHLPRYWSYPSQENVGILDREKVATGKDTLDCCLCQEYLKSKQDMKVAEDPCLVLQVACCSLGGGNQTVIQLFPGVFSARMLTLGCAMTETLQSMTLLTSFSNFFLTHETGVQLKQSLLLRLLSDFQPLDGELQGDIAF